ncbi:MAG TPA: hypothetical protein ENK53_00545 [Thiotrichales bacterium]|nr:hypothetical protein [Thiotrichales bacterium]
MKKHDIREDCVSDIRLQAFIDDELPGEERQRFLEAMEEDPALRERVCRMRMTSEWVRQAFEDVEPPSKAPIRAGRATRRRWPMALAASLLLFGVGLLVGRLCVDHETAGLQSVVLQDIEASRHRVLLHIEESDPERFRNALDQAERLLTEYAETGIRVDVLVNAGGIDLLRADVSPYVQRVAGLMQRFGNHIQFVACTNSIRRLEERGQQVILIDHVRTDTTAVDHVIHRLQEGWAYVRI